MTRVRFLLAEPADIRTVVESDPKPGEISRAEAESLQAAGVPIKFIEDSRHSRNPK